jgi:hypothetical protein
MGNISSAYLEVLEVEAPSAKTPALFPVLVEFGAAEVVVDGELLFTDGVSPKSLKV